MNLEDTAYAELGQVTNTRAAWLCVELRGREQNGTYHRLGSDQEGRGCCPRVQSYG
jgi:hypothetical protein